MVFEDAQTGDASLSNGVLLRLAVLERSVDALAAVETDVAALDKRLENRIMHVEGLVTDLSEHMQKNNKDQEELLSMVANIEGFFVTLNKIGSIAKPIVYIAAAVTGIISVWDAVRPFFWGGR